MMRPRARGLLFRRRSLFLLSLSLLRMKLEGAPVFYLAPRARARGVIAFCTSKARGGDAGYRFAVIEL